VSKIKVNWCTDSSNKTTCHVNGVIGLDNGYVGRIWFNDDGTWGASVGIAEDETVLSNKFNNGGLARRAVELAVSGSQVNEWD